MSDQFSREALALALARESAAALKRYSGTDLSYVMEQVRHLTTALDVLDDMGVFSPIDQQTGYTAAADVLAANAENRFVSPAGLAHSQIRHPAGQDVQGLNQVPLSPAGGWSTAELADTTGKDDTEDGRF